MLHKQIRKTNSRADEMRLCLSLCGVVLLLVSSIQAALPLARTAGGQTSTSQQRRNGEKVQSNEFNLGTQGSRARWSEDHVNYEVRSKEDLVFNDSDTDVQSLSRAGSLMIREERDGTVRTIEVVQGPDGQPQRTYTIGGAPREFDQDARAWLARVLPLVIRTTGAGANARVQRLLKQGGAAAVLDEISRVRIDGARVIYFQYLLKNGNLDAAALRRTSRQVAKEISSDGDKARVLIEAAGLYLNNADAAAAFFDAADSIKSDVDHRRVLTAVLKRSNLNRQALLGMVRSAGRMSSDGDKAGFLIDAGHLYLNDATVSATFFEAVSSIKSGGDRRRVLSTLLRRNKLGRENLLLALKSAAAITSDGDKAEVFIELAEAGTSDKVVRVAVRDAARDIKSVGDRERVMAALAQE
jgi:hypothetical protein